MKIANYCIENSILAMGWSLKDDHLKNHAPDILQCLAFAADNLETKEY
jgi:hypothetical protein